MGEATEHQPVDRIIGIVERFGRGLLSLLKLVVFLTFLVFAGILGAYIYSLYGLPTTDPHRDAALQRLEQIMSTMWDRMLPIATTALQIIAPVIVLLLALALLFVLARRKPTTVDVPKLITDLPSFLAILIVSTICVLPLAGVAIPQSLNNIALVVVGFYFGKRVSNTVEA